MSRTIGELLDQPQELQTWLHEVTALQAMLHAVASTRLLDQWDAQPVHLEDLAARTGIEETQVERLVKLLASQGVLGIAPDGAICHTLRSRALQGMCASVMVQRLALLSALRLGDALRTGKTAFEVCFGKPAFEYFAANPEQADYFAQRMTQITMHDEPQILEQLDFAPFRLAVDIGGSHGTLLLGLLAKYPGARGIVFDLPDVAARAAERLRTHPQSSRIDTIAGDFFHSVPASGDLYLLKQILHNWDDAQCTAILKSVRAAIVPTGRIAVIDRLLPENITPDMAYEFDILMMVWSTGRERSLARFRELLGSAGFAIAKVSVNPGRMSIIEAIPS